MHAGTASWIAQHEHWTRHRQYQDITQALKVPGMQQEQNHVTNRCKDTIKASAEVPAGHAVDSSSKHSTGACRHNEPYTTYSQGQNGTRTGLMQPQQTNGKVPH